MDEGIYTYEKKTGRKVRSGVWRKFAEIFEFDATNTKSKVKHFFYCTVCCKIEYNPYEDGNTNRLLRHVCYEKNNESEKNNGKIIVRKSDKESLKVAAAKFVSKDLRPFIAIEGEGLQDLCFASMQFGQQNRKATRDDLISAMPTRNTVKNAIAEIADTKRKQIRHSLRRAIETGGIAATCDNWTDDYRHQTYMTIVAHICIYEEGKATYQQFVLSTREITDIIKTGEINKILKCQSNIV